MVGIDKELYVFINVKNLFKIPNSMCYSVKYIEFKVSYFTTFLSA